MTDTEILQENRAYLETAAASVVVQVAEALCSLPEHNFREKLQAVHIAAKELEAQEERAKQMRIQLREKVIRMYDTAVENWTPREIFEVLSEVSF